jgi:hypothetical protein
MLYLIFIITSFLLGIYFIVNFGKINNTNHILEGFINSTDKKGFKCPNVLVQKGVKYYLYNSKLAQVPGVNPIQFEHLEDYVEFMNWQRSQGIRCPILYLQHGYNAQGEPTYKIRPDPLDLQGGLPPSLVNTPSAPPKQQLGPEDTLLVDASRNDSPYNKNSMPGFDQSNYYQGTKNPLDNIAERDENMLYSPNPMDDNWGGQKYTQKLVDSGYYAGNEVSLRIA